MKAVEGTRYIKERTKLETVVPLDTPFVLFVDPSSACNISCSFCPCGNSHKDLWSETRRKGVGTMPLELFRKILEDCKEFPEPIKVLRLYKEGEPLLNPHFEEMVALAKESGLFHAVDTTTNGLLLNPKRNRELVRAGLSRINISVEGLSSNAYQKICGARIDFEEFRANIKDLYDHKGNCHIFIKTVAEEGTISGQAEDAAKKAHFEELFGDICDEISFEYPSPTWPGFEFEKEAPEVGIYGNEIRPCTVCPYIFYGMPVNSDGTVSLCFADWNRQLLIGDVHDHTVAELWHKMDCQRMAHLTGERKKMPVCNVCLQPELTAIDRIDEFKEEILARMQNVQNIGER